MALSGSFDVVLDDGNNKKIFSLNRSYYGLYVPKGLWREMNNFSTNSLALILSSTVYEEKDYIRDYNEFLKMKTQIGWELILRISIFRPQIQCMIVLLLNSLK